MTERRRRKVGLRVFLMSFMDVHARCPSSAPAWCLYIPRPSKPRVWTSSNDASLQLSSTQWHARPGTSIAATGARSSINRRKRGCRARYVPDSERILESARRADLPNGGVNAFLRAFKPRVVYRQRRTNHAIATLYRPIRTRHPVVRRTKSANVRLDVEEGYGRAQYVDSIKPIGRLKT
ncbi:hypothetical protein C8Q70DRAFT_1035511 [Cubamyces menziesii]|nr:hypothetical protein C8Q70DRAFT_1035511 [Cubamyces menziesii]